MTLLPQPQRQYCIENLLLIPQVPEEPLHCSKAILNLLWIHSVTESCFSWSQIKTWGGHYNQQKHVFSNSLLKEQLQEREWECVYVSISLSEGVLKIRTKISFSCLYIQEHQRWSLNLSIINLGLLINNIINLKSPIYTYIVIY